jgi:L-seryl-tRNA(Ser) seleniumtransferase
MGLDTDLNSDIISTVYSMLLLENYNIITIPAVGMPGASKTIRLDWSAKDSSKLTMDELVNAIVKTFDDCKEVIESGQVESILY